MKREFASQRRPRACELPFGSVRTDFVQGREKKKPNGGGDALLFLHGSTDAHEAVNVAGRNQRRLAMLTV